MMATYQELFDLCHNQELIDKAMVAIILNAGRVR